MSSTLPFSSVAIAFSKEHLLCISILHLPPPPVHLSFYSCCSPPPSILVSADKVMYTAVTVGCPTAYRMKYRGGGLAKMQVLPTIMPSVGSFSTSAGNKGFRLKTLLGKIMLSSLMLCPQWIGKVLGLCTDQARTSTAELW